MVYGYSMTKTIEFKVATCNVQSLPKLRNIKSQLKSINGIHLAGLQEVDPADYKREVLKAYPHALGIGTLSRLKNETYSCPIRYSKALITCLRSGSVKIYDGEAGVSLTRHLTHGHFQFRGNKLEFGAVNLHSVKMTGIKQVDRKRMKAEAKEKTFATVRRYTSKGLPVIVTGDFNDKANWFGKQFDGRRVIRVGQGIDQILFIAGDREWWEVLGTNRVETASDHDTIRVRVALKQA